MSYRDVVASAAMDDLRSVRSGATVNTNPSRLRIKFAGRTVVTTVPTVAAAERPRADGERPNTPNNQLAQGELERLYVRIKSEGFPLTRGGADPPELVPGNPIQEIEPAPEELQQVVPQNMEISQALSEQGMPRSWFGWFRDALRVGPQYVTNLPATRRPDGALQGAQPAGTDTATRRVVHARNPLAGSDARGERREPAPASYDITPEEYAMILRERERGMPPHSNIVHVGGILGQVAGARALATPSPDPMVNSAPAAAASPVDRRVELGTPNGNNHDSAAVAGSHGITKILSTLGVDKPRTLSERLNDREKRAREEFVEMKKTKPLSEVLTLLADVHPDIVQELLSTPGVDTPSQQNSGVDDRIRVRVPKPAPFTGVGGTQVRMWLRNLESYLLHETGRSEVTTQMLFAAEQYLDGAARQYWAAESERMRKTGTVLTWDSFTASLITGFGGIDPAQSARDRMASMRQRKGETAEKLTVRFLQQLALLDEPMAEPDVIAHYKNALLPELRRQVVTALATRKVSTFAEYADFVRHFEHDLQLDELARKRVAREHDDVAGDPLKPPQKKHRGARGGQSARQRINQLSVQAEKQEASQSQPAQHKKEKQLKNNAANTQGAGTGAQTANVPVVKPKKCYGCHQEGHVIADCPVMKKAQELLKKQNK